MSIADKDYVKYRLSRAKESFEEVKVLAKNEMWNGCINRLYYACFYAVSALLLQNNIQTKTHAGARQMFGLHFVDKGLIF